MLVNTDSFFFLDGSNAHNMVISSYKGLLHNLIETPYYYLEFKHGLNHLSDYIPSDILLKIISKEYNLVLCNSHEAFHSVVNEVYQHAILGLGIPESSIILMSESADINKEVYRVATELGKEQIRTIWARVFELSGQTYLCHTTSVPNTLQTYFPYKKVFLNLNRRWRNHRPMLVALLYIRNLLQHGYVSLARNVEIEIDWQKIWPWLSNQYSQDLYPEIYNKLEENKEKILSMPDLKLDVDNLSINQAHFSSDTDYLYASSLVSLVTETNFYNDSPGRFISEKIIKPITFCHPQIIVSRPHTLSLLRELGYKTFSPWINEDYDQEEDDNTRLLMIVDEIDRLTKLSMTGRIDFLNGVREICEYNKKVLVAKKNFSSILPTIK